MRRALILLSLFIGVIALGLTVAPLFIDIDKRLRPTIENYIAKSTNAQLDLGKLSFSLWRGFVIKIESLSVQSRRTSEVALTTGAAELHVGLLSLLRPPIHLEFRVTGAGVHIVKYKSGRLNLQNLFKTEGSSAQSEGAGGGSSASMSMVPPFTLDISILDSQINYRSEQDKNDLKLQNMNVVVRHIGLNENIDFKLFMTANYKTIQENIKIPLETNGVLRVVTKENRISSGHLEGALFVFGASLADIRSEVDFENPENTKINIISKNVNFDDYQGVLKPFLNLRLTGSLSTNIDLWPLRNPLIAQGSGKLTLGLGSSDLAADVSIKKSTEWEHRSHIEARQLNIYELLSILPEGLSRELALTAKGLVVEKIQIYSHGGLEEMTFDPVKFKVFQGQVENKIHYKSLGRDERNIKVEGSVRGLQVEDAIEQFKPELKGVLSGFLQSQYRISLSGKSTQEYMSSLQGTGHVSMNQAHWSGVSQIKKIGEKLKSIPAVANKIGEIKVGDTFKKLESDFEISQQVFHIRSLTGDMEESNVSITGDGHVDFNLNILLRGLLLAPLSNPPQELRAADGRAKIPYEIKGKASEPTLNWDLSTNAVAKAYLKGEGTKTINNEIKKLKENVKDERLKKLLEKVPDDVGNLLKDIKF